MEFCQLDISDPHQRQRYDALFEECPNAFVQQSSWWADVIAEVGPDKPIFLLASDSSHALGGLPLYLLEHPLGNILNSVPYPGPLGGVILRPNLPAALQREVYRTLLEGALGVARAHRCLSLTCITSPFAQDLEFYTEFLAPDFILENFTQSVRLSDRERRSGGARNNLARARRFGFSVEVVETSAQLEEWCALHRQRQGELRAALPSERLYHAIFQNLVPRGKALFLLVRAGENVASCGLYVFHRSVMDVYAIDMNSTFAQHAPNALATEFSMRYARDRGVQIYNWQSSPSRSNGVYMAKKLWGGVETLYYFVTVLPFGHASIQRIGLDTIRSEYPWHYVVPFDAFQQGFDVTHFRKA